MQRAYADSISCAHTMYVNPDQIFSFNLNFYECGLNFKMVLYLRQFLNLYTRYSMYIIYVCVFLYTIAYVHIHVPILHIKQMLLFYYILFCFLPVSFFLFGILFFIFMFASVTPAKSIGWLQWKTDATEMENVNCKWMMSVVAYLIKVKENLSELD